MNAGVVKTRYKKSELDAAVKHYKDEVLPAIATHQGARTAMLLINRETGDAVSIAIYENRQSAESFAPKAEKLIESFTRFTNGRTVPQREVYEIAASTMIESKAVVERGIKAFNAHDLEALARDSTADVEGTAPGDIHLKGPQAAKEFNQNFISAFPDARAEAKHIIAQGSHVVVHGVFTGTHNGTLKTPMGDLVATGRKVRGEYVQIFEVDRGLIKKVDLLYDQVQLMTQLGLAPAPAPPKQGVKAGQ